MALRIVSPEAASVTPAAWHPWEGGRFRTVDGVETYYIRQRLGDGARFEKAVANSLDEARAELALFTRDPAGYRTKRERAAQVLTASAASGAVCLDDETLKAFFQRCKALVDKGEMSLVHYRESLIPYLTQWGAALRGRDLHTLAIDDLQAAFVKEKWVTAKHKRIVALKSFTKWARVEKTAPKLRRAQDPTIDLATPKIVRKKTRSRERYSIELVQRLYRALPDQRARDIIRLRACANGLHDTEIERIASGDAELARLDDPCGIAGVLRFWQAKKQDWHEVSVDAPTFAAAERLAKSGHLRRRALLTMLNAVAIEWHGCGGIEKRWKREGRPDKPTRRIVPCKGCMRFHPSRLRHAFATWALTIGEEIHPTGQKGVPLAVVSERMAHKNKDTTKGFYVGEHVPSMIRIVGLELTHPNDPR